MSEQTLEPVRQEQFAERMGQVLHDSCPGYLCSLGHRTGLFDVMSGLPPSTSAQIAVAARLDERYVREWLGGMTVGGFVEYGRPEENIGHPLGPALYPFSVFYGMTVSLGRAAALGAVWGKQRVLRLLGDAGFGDVEVREVEGGVLNVYYVARKRRRWSEVGRDEVTGAVTSRVAPARSAGGRAGRGSPAGRGRADS
ncbi:hypothetical protein ACWDZ4_15430 [Streptomyces sp. NPDC003016]